MIDSVIDFYNSVLNINQIGAADANVILMRSFVVKHNVFRKGM